jgi:hypothetical protein
VEDSNSPCASTSACQSSARAAARGSLPSARSVARRSASTASGSRSSSAQKLRCFSHNASMLAAMFWPSAMACRVLVTPDRAETTMSTRRLGTFGS